MIKCIDCGKLTNEEDAEDKAQVLALAAYGGAFVKDCWISSEEME